MQPIVRDTYAFSKVMSLQAAIDSASLDSKMHFAVGS